MDISKYAAEFIGTFALVFVGAGSIVANDFTNGALGVTGIALAHGLILMGVVYSLGFISGAHVNPAVTLALLLHKKISAKEGVFYFISQFLGAIVAGFVIVELLPVANVTATSAGGTLLANNISLLQGIGIEAILTFFLVSAVFLTAVRKKAHPAISGISIGLTLAASILVGGAFTGASLNPARALGPAVALGIYDSLLAHFIGPIIGAILAFIAFRYIYREN